MCPITETNDSLVLEDVTFGYVPDQPVVRSVSTRLAAGKVTVLIGPNAAGKTSLLRLMLGQLAAGRGRVLCGGVDVRTMRSAQRAALISYVPQRGGVRFGFGVEQVVRMGRFALAADEGAIERAIADCGLAKLRRRSFAALSVGQQQRVLLARALAQSAGSPKGRGVMLLDEPGSAMDPWHVHRTMGLLRREASAGAAVLVVLHDLNLAARYADVVWLMADGRLVQRGRWDEVMRPEHLEPVYRVRFIPLVATAGGRPVFYVEPADTLSEVSPSAGERGDD